MVKLKYFYKNKYSKGKHTRNLKYYSRAERPIKDFKDKAEEIFKNVEQKQVVVAQSCLCNPTDCSTPGFPVLHHVPELA